MKKTIPLLLILTLGFSCISSKREKADPNILGKWYGLRKGKLFSVQLSTKNKCYLDLHEFKFSEQFLKEHNLKLNSKYYVGLEEDPKSITFELNVKHPDTTFVFTFNGVYKQPTDTTLLIDLAISTEPTPTDFGADAILLFKNEEWVKQLQLENAILDSTNLDNNWVPSDTTTRKNKSQK